MATIQRRPPNPFSPNLPLSLQRGYQLQQRNAIAEQARLQAEEDARVAAENARIQAENDSNQRRADAINREADRLQAIEDRKQVLLKEYQRGEQLTTDELKDLFGEDAYNESLNTVSSLVYGPRRKFVAPQKEFSPLIIEGQPAISMGPIETIYGEQLTSFVTKSSSGKLKNVIQTPAEFEPDRFTPNVIFSRNVPKETLSTDVIKNIETARFEDFVRPIPTSIPLLQEPFPMVSINLPASFEINVGAIAMPIESNNDIFDFQEAKSRAIDAVAPQLKIRGLSEFQSRSEFQLQSGQKSPRKQFLDFLRLPDFSPGTQKGSVRFILPFGPGEIALAGTSGFLSGGFRKTAVRGAERVFPGNEFARPATEIGLELASLGVTYKAFGFLQSTVFKPSSVEFVLNSSRKQIIGTPGSGKGVIGARSEGTLLIDRTPKSLDALVGPVGRPYSPRALFQSKQPVEIRSIFQVRTIPKIPGVRGDVDPLLSRLRGETSRRLPGIKTSDIPEALSGGAAAREFAKSQKDLLKSQLRSTTFEVKQQGVLIVKGKEIPFGVQGLQETTKLRGFEQGRQVPLFTQQVGNKAIFGPLVDKELLRLRKGLIVSSGSGGKVKQFFSKGTNVSLSAGSPFELAKPTRIKEQLFSRSGQPIIREGKPVFKYTEISKPFFFEKEAKGTFLGRDITKQAKNIYFDNIGGSGKFIQSNTFKTKFLEGKRRGLESLRGKTSGTIIYDSGPVSKLSVTEDIFNAGKKGTPIEFAESRNILRKKFEESIKKYKDLRTDPVSRQKSLSGLNKLIKDNFRRGVEKNLGRKVSDKEINIILSDRAKVFSSLPKAKISPVRGYSIKDLEDLRFSGVKVKAKNYEPFALPKSTRAKQELGEALSSLSKSERERVLGRKLSDEDFRIVLKNINATGSGSGSRLIPVTLRPKKSLQDVVFSISKLDREKSLGRKLTDREFLSELYSINSRATLRLPKPPIKEPKTLGEALSDFYKKEQAKKLAKKNSFEVDQAFRLAPSRREARLARELGDSYLPPVGTAREAGERIVQAGKGFPRQTFREVPPIKFSQQTRDYFAGKFDRQADTAFGLTKRGRELLRQGIPTTESGIRAKDIVRIGRESQPIKDISTITGMSPNRLVKRLGNLPVEALSPESLKNTPGLQAAIGFTEKGRLGLGVGRLKGRAFTESAIVHEFEHAGEKFAKIPIPKVNANSFEYFSAPTERRAFAVQERFLESRGKTLPLEEFLFTNPTDPSLIQRVRPGSAAAGANSVTQAFRLAPSVGRTVVLPSLAPKAVSKQSGLFVPQTIVSDKTALAAVRAASQPGILAVGATNLLFRKQPADQANRVLTFTVPKVRPLLQPLYRPLVLPNTQPLIVPKNIPRTVPRVLPRIIPRTIPRVRAITTPLLVPRVIPRTIPRITPIIPPTLPPEPPPRKDENKFIPKEFRGRKPGFIPVLFKRGKPIGRIYKQSLTLKDALAVGSRFVDQTIKRSFKVVPTGEFVEEKFFRGPTGILRPGKRDPFLFVERSRFAISTGGEKTALKVGRQAKLSKLLNRRTLLGRVY